MDHAKAERCALVDSKQAAMELLNARNTNRTQYASVVDISGVQYSLTPAGGIVSDPSGLDRPTTLADTQSQIQKYTERLREKEKEMTVYKTEHQKLSPKLQEASSEITKAKACVLYFFIIMKSNRNYVVIAFNL